MFSSNTSSMSSSTSAFGSSRFLFGQTSNANASSKVPFESQYMLGQSSRPNIFGSVPSSSGGALGRLYGTPLGSTPMQGTSSSPALWGFATASMSSSPSAFGSSFLFGQTSNSNVSSTIPVGSQYMSGQIGSPNILGSVSISAGGSSASIFGSPLSSTSLQGTSSSPVIWGSSTGSTTPFQTPASNASSFPVSGFCWATSSIPATSPFGTSNSTFASNSTFGNTAYSFGTQNSFSGSTTFPQTTATNPSSSPAFSFGFMTASGQATVPLSSSGLSGTSAYPFRIQSPFTVNQVRTPNSGFLKSEKSSSGVKHGGSRVVRYTKTTESEMDDAGKRVNYLSICAMPAYKDRSHEELRWEDHHQFNAEGDGVDPTSVTFFRSPIARTDNSFPSPIPPPSALSNPFSTTLTTPSFEWNSFSNHILPSASSNPFSTTITPSFRPNPSLNPTPLPQPNPLFTTVMTPLSGPSPSLASVGQPTSRNPFLYNSYISPFTSVIQPVSSFEPDKSPSLLSPPIPTTNPYPSISNSSPGAAFILEPNYSTSVSSSPSFCSTNVTSPVTASVPCTTAAFLALSQPSPTSLTEGLSSSGIDGFKGVGGQTTLAQQQLPSPNIDVKQSSLMYPFGPPSEVSQILAEGTGTVRYGISSIPISERPSVARSPSLPVARHLSYCRRKRLPIRKYNPKSDAPKVAFFTDAQKVPNTARKEAPLLPRSNPRAFTSGLYEELNLEVNCNNISVQKHMSIHVDDKGNSGETNVSEHCKPSSFHSDHPIKKEVSSNVYALMPKLKHNDYFIQPRVEELAIKENSEPGFCSHVKDFVVGRQGYGSIKFLEETDVRELDLESYIEFRNHEVIVLGDEKKKPPVGQGLNKAAEITLCNIKCVDKTTGKQHTSGPKVDKFKEKLMKKATEQGAEFVSYDPVQGEWKFRVQHF